ncbi:MAG TPA: ROK family protein [Acidimicrobiales bacterium]|nr:ROK family protein [Acidimicrobiales bacterium]
MPHIQPGYLPSETASGTLNQPAAIGIDFGGTNTQVVVIDADGNVISDQVKKTPHSGPAIADIVAEIVIESAGAGLPLGIGAPVLMSPDGMIVGAPNLSATIGTNFRKSIEARLSELERPPVSLVIDNDATCAAVGELYLGCAQGVGHAAVVTLGTGIGGGLIVDGKVMRGANGFAGEIGHMIVDPSGPPCPCGRNGCWERYASGTGLARLARDAAHAGKAQRVVEIAGGDPESVRGEHVSLACVEGDAEAKQIMSSFGWWVALGLVNLTVIMDLELCVLGGGPITSGDVLLGPVTQHFDELMPYSNSRPQVQLALAAQGVRAGAIGAAWLAYTSA